MSPTQSVEYLGKKESSTGFFLGPVGGRNSAPFPTVKNVYFSQFDQRNFPMGHEKKKK